MRILLVGAGGVGTAFARIAARRPFAELVIADYDLGRAQRAVAARDGYQAVQLDARDEQAAAGLLSQHRCDVLRDATIPCRAPGRHALPGHGDVAVLSPSGGPVPADRRQARRRAVRAGTGMGT